MIGLYIIIAAAFIFVLLPVIDGLTGKYTFSRLYGAKYMEITENEEQTETSEKDELKELNKQERIDIQEKTLVQYNKLLDNLAAQYIEETNEKKKAVILAKQISTLEKYNKALEKMEKLE